MHALREETSAFYEPLRFACVDEAEAYQRTRGEIWEAMDRFADENPECPAVVLKARLHTEIAERFEPAVFRHSPFYFEMGLRPAENWGDPVRQHVGAWSFARRSHLSHSHPDWARIGALNMYGNGPYRIWAIFSPFDFDHHCLGYTSLLETGVNGVLENIEARRRRPLTAAQDVFLRAAEESTRALLRVAERFADKAAAMLENESDPQCRRFLSQIAAAARRVPAEPPRTFYEGLAALLFLREATASMEAIGISVIGHPDRHLGALYEQDRRSGLLTEEDARDLLARWMVFTDVRFHVEDSEWPETSTCIELGGCDADGVPVFNDVTRLIIETHRDHNLINPKLNCRYGKNSPQEYLDLMSATLLDGHNVFALLNDDVLIPACVRRGKTEREARLYVNGGCQETIVEGVEHSAGAYYYFNMARVLDLCLQPVRLSPEVRLPEGTERAVPDVIGGAVAFEDYYQAFVAALGMTISLGADWLREPGLRWHDVLPCPWFSSTLEGCIEAGKDYTAGGAKYNEAGLALVGLGTVVDSLHAIRRAVFEEGWVTLEELAGALARNWQELEPLRARLVSLEKFGHGHKEVDQLAGRFCRDLAAIAAPLRNERGGGFQPSFFVYYQFVYMGGTTRATPDGRRNGDMLSQGVAPGRVRASDDLPAMFHALREIDLADFPGNAVLDFQLPLGQAMEPAHLSAVFRTFADFGGLTVQPNCVSVDDLREAQERPEEHAGLIVRISGLSARFVALERKVQDEIIDRAIMRT